MIKNIILSMVLFLLLAIMDEMFKESGDPAKVHRNRMFKFAIYQDLLVGLSVLKMMVIEGYTLSGVVQRIRTSGAVTYVYMATSVVVHGALLFDDTTNHRLRLNPAPYTPPALDEDQKALFLL